MRVTQDCSKVLKSSKVLNGPPWLSKVRSGSLRFAQVHKGSLRQMFAWVLCVAIIEFKCFQRFFLQSCSRFPRGPLKFSDIHTSSIKCAKTCFASPTFVKVRQRSPRSDQIQNSLGTRWGSFGFSGFRSGPWRFAELC